MSTTTRYQQMDDLTGGGSHTNHDDDQGREREKKNCKQNCMHRRLRMRVYVVNNRVESGERERFFLSSGKEIFSTEVLSW